MLDKLKQALRAKATGEGQSRTDEQTPALTMIPSDEPFTVSEFARYLGVSRYKAQQTLDKLQEDGLVVQVSTPEGQRIKYQIIGEGPNLSKVTDVQSPDVSQEADMDIVNITNALVWEFIRETRSTDVLVFLTWLERQGGSDA